MIATSFPPCLRRLLISNSYGSELVKCALFFLSINTACVLTIKGHPSDVGNETEVTIKREALLLSGGDTDYATSAGQSDSFTVG